jgi:2-phosphoglycerate kinase
VTVVDVDDDGVVLPFAASILARDLVTAGLPTADALQLAGKVGDVLASHGQPVVSSAVLGSETARQLAIRGEHRVLRRLRVRWWMRTERVPVVIAIGGTSGSGKSSVSQEVAHRLGIDAVVSTDVVRAILRVTLHPEMLPALSESSFSAQRMFRSNLEGNRLLVAFEQQATIVFHAALGLVRRTIKEGHQLVLNGVHIVPGLVDVPADWSFFPYMLTVPDRDDHRRRFEARFATSDRPADYYQSRLAAIRELDDYLVGYSRRAGVPVVESVGFEQTVADLIDAIAMDLENAFAIP